MATYDFDIGIIGGGSAGLTIAAGASQLGAKTILLEKEKELGGDCLHFGCVPSKTLIKTARVYHQMKNAKVYGLPETDVPPVDFSKVVERIRSVIGTIQKHDSAERFCGLGARVECGNPVFVDEHAVSLDGIPYTAKTWVIASGSSPVIPPIPAPITHPKSSASSASTPTTVTTATMSCSSSTASSSISVWISPTAPTTASGASSS